MKNELYRQNIIFFFEIFSKTRGALKKINSFANNKICPMKQKVNTSWWWLSCNFQKS